MGEPGAGLSRENCQGRAGGTERVNYGEERSEEGSYLAALTVFGFLQLWPVARDSNNRLAELLSCRIL
jgi:hypothetical protein